MPFIDNPTTDAATERTRIMAVLGLGQESPYSKATALTIKAIRDGWSVETFTAKLAEVHAK